MNQKQAKTLRKLLRSIVGVEPRDVTYLSKTTKKTVYTPEGRAVTIDGGTSTYLDPECGRAQYKKMKKEFVAAQQRGDLILKDFRNLTAVV